MKIYCERCKKETNTTTTSMFNTQTICMECKRKEEQHPLYNQAREKEYQEVLKGNFNYEGIGLPFDLIVT